MTVITPIKNLPVASPADYLKTTAIVLDVTDPTTGQITTKQGTLEALKENYSCNINCASLSIASADVLQLNSTPLTIVSAAGAGKAIEVISASVKVNFNTAAYATNVYIMLINSGATDEQFGAGILNASVSTIRKLQEVTTTTASDTQIIANTDLQVQVKTGDPATGDSDIDVFVLYRIITV